MKETINYTLWVYENTFGLIKLDGIKSLLLRLMLALFMFPFLFVFVILALLIEEPLKLFFLLLFFRITPKEAWKYYKKCWKSLLTGMKSQ